MEDYIREKYEADIYEMRRKQRAFASDVISSTWMLDFSLVVGEHARVEEKVDLFLRINEKLDPTAFDDIQRAAETHGYNIDFSSNGIEFKLKFTLK